MCAAVISIIYSMVLEKAMIVYTMMMQQVLIKRAGGGARGAGAAPYVCVMFSALLTGCVIEHILSYSADIEHIPCYSAYRYRTHSVL